MLASLLLPAVLTVGCGDDTPEPSAEWQLVQQDLDGALLSVWGTSANDVWIVGADARDDTGPTVAHFDGEAWERVDTGQTQGSLWWVYGFEEGPLFMGGDGGVILRYEDDEFSVMDTPGNDTVYGIWGASADAVWAVGGASESGGGFAWHLVDDAWQPEASVPEDIAGEAALWKMFGSAEDDAWVVGSNGVSLHWDGDSFSTGDTGVGTSLFTVHAGDGRYAAVGGVATGIIVEYDGEWRQADAEPVPPGLSGVYLDDNGGGIAVGMLGAIYSRGANGWSEIDHGLDIDRNFHATWLDEQDGIWAVGGQTFTEPFTAGLLVHRGATLPTGGL